MPKRTFEPSHALRTGIASCVVLVPIGCERPSAPVAVTPGESAAPSVGEVAVCPPCARAQPPGSPDDHDPPVILDARFIARDRVQLTFNEALAPVDAVNPRQFRLSHGYSVVDFGEYGYGSGTYYDLGGTDNYEQPLVIVALERSEEHPELLGLLLSRPIPVELCEQINEQQTTLKTEASAAATAGGGVVRGQAGVFLHYTSRGSVGVRDSVHNPLADIGAHWALNFGARSMQLYGSEPATRFDLLPELPCPEPAMGKISPSSSSAGPR
jgi:hypothetical protein